MKKLIAPALIALISALSLSAISRQSKLTKPACQLTNLDQNLEDTIFISNYFCKRYSYLYSKPNLSSKTKTKIPKNVAITTINEFGDFEYGSFNISHNKSFRGWFLKADLQSLSFTQPKINK